MRSGVHPALVFLCATFAAIVAGADGAAPAGGHLARAVLLGGPPLAAKDLPATLPAPDRLALLAYLDRRDSFASRLDATAGDAALHERRVRLEREIASVVGRPGIELEAAAIAGEAPLAADPASNPSAEAEWAESVLRARPGTVAAPYLYGFLASRYRLTFERLEGDDDPALERLARKYRTMLERVRGSGDRLLVLLAEDLDGLPVLGPDGTRHPRTYLPDT